MDEQVKARQVQALQVLAKAAELYLTNADELTKTFVVPQVQGAVQILAQLIEATHAPAPETAADVKADPAA